MSLVIVLNDSLDTMQSKVEEMFGQVANKNINPVSYADQPTPYTADKLGKLVRVVPVKDADILKISWVMPPMVQHRNDKPDIYFLHLLASEGKGSI
jgi:secreted Zn-dependent insulinase-like peptidase